MTSDLQLLMLWTCAGIGLAVLFANYWWVRRAVRASAHVTSRFPLFAARDELRRAWIDRKLRTDDSAVSVLDTTINDLLSLDNRVTLVDFLKHYFKAKIREARDPEYAAQAQETRNLFLAKARENEVFDRVLRASDAAVGQMLTDRTSWLSLQGFVLRLQMIKVFVDLLRFRRLLSFRNIGTVDLFARHAGCGNEPPSPGSVGSHMGMLKSG